MIAKKEEVKAKAYNETKSKENIEKVVPKAKKLMKIYDTIPKELVDALRNCAYGVFNEEKLINFLSKNVAIKKIDLSEIKNNVLIASIDADSLTELKSKLKIDL